VPIRLVPHSGLVSKLQTFVLKHSPYICTELSVVKSLNTDQPTRALAYSGCITGAQIFGARSPGRLIFLLLRLAFVGVNTLLALSKIFWKI